MTGGIQPSKVERLHALEDAWARGVRAAAGVGLDIEDRHLGGGSEYSAWYCRLVDGDGTMPAEAEGLGKGTAAEARVGALFEALEHCWLGPHGFDREVLVSRCSEAIVGQPEFRADVAAQFFEAITDIEVPAITYRGLNNKGTVDVPYGLVNPWWVEDANAALRCAVGDTFPYRNVMRYSTNSGAASGVGWTEAVLHGLNECLERDAFSLLLVRAFLRPTPLVQPFTLIDRSSLPHYILGALDMIAALRGAPVHLLDIGSDFGVTTVVAYCEPTDTTVPRRGVGASADPVYAAWRAVCELLQTLLHTPADEDRTLLAPLERYPALYEAARFDLRGTLGMAKESPLPRGDREPGSPDAQLDRLCTVLAEAGIDVYWRPVAVLDSDIHVVHVYAPLLERFMLTVGGCLVVPGRRAMLQ